MKKKFAVYTSTRAEYGLLYPLIKRLKQKDSFEVDIIVSGTHLLDKYGYTIKYIEADGIDIKYKVPILEEGFSSSEEEVTRAISEGLRQCGDILARENYCGVIVLGDRYELLCICIAAMVCRIPIIHIHGGELTEGAIDDKIRHAITKIASIHFPSIEEYANRIIQMGENPNCVYPVGALGIENIKSMELIKKQDLCKELNLPVNKKIAAVTFHPETGETSRDKNKEVEELLKALLEMDLFSVITMPNSDVGGDEIYRTLCDYVEKYSDKMVLRKSLGQLRYLSLLSIADIMVGNSSSGIIESASFRLPTVNIGERQKGRLAPENVIHCDCRQKEIEAAIRIALSESFRISLKSYVNPYGDGDTSVKIVDVLDKIDFCDKKLIMKEFYDINWVQK